jgi:hypothetical protein
MRFLLKFKHGLLFKVLTAATLLMSIVVTVISDNCANDGHECQYSGSHSCTVCDECTDALCELALPSYTSCSEQCSMCLERGTVHEVDCGLCTCGETVDCPGSCISAALACSKGHQPHTGTACAEGDDECSHCGCNHKCGECGAFGPDPCWDHEMIWKACGEIGSGNMPCQSQGYVMRSEDYTCIFHLF